MLQQGESVVYVKDQLGHASIQLTVDTYGHLIPGANRAAVDRLDDVSTHPSASQAHPGPETDSTGDQPKSFVEVVNQTFASWNQIAGWLRRLEGLRGAA